MKLKKKDLKSIEFTDKYIVRWDGISIDKKDNPVLLKKDKMFLKIKQQKNNLRYFIAKKQLKQQVGVRTSGSGNLGVLSIDSGRLFGSVIDLDYDNGTMKMYNFKLNNKKKIIAFDVLYQESGKYPGVNKISDQYPLLRSGCARST